MASDAAPEEFSRKNAFVSFVSGHGGRKDLINSISISDLYYELAYHRWLIEGTIPVPGRLHRFSSLDDPILHLLEDAGLPLTAKDSRALLETIMRILKHEFRTMPWQPLRKTRFVKLSALVQLIADRVRRTRLSSIADNLCKALIPLLRNKKVGAILYERFRSESIHGATVLLDTKKFFTETEVYWKALYSEYYGAFEIIEFPAQFLLLLLEQCVSTYRSALLAKGKVPPAVHFYVFGDDMFTELNLLDTDLLPEGGDVRFRIPPR
jgi:hypothetical protein